MLEEFNNKIENLDIKWELNPFPHAIIDNFLPEEIFLNLKKEFKLFEDPQNITKKFKTYLEFNKQAYGEKNLTNLLKYPVDILGGKSFIKLLQKHIGDIKITSLNKWEDYGGYYPLHQMGNEGMLGSHVDHSHYKKNYLHFANSIYFFSPVWEKYWGGEILLFNKMGLHKVKEVKPLPNRLVIFIHSANSFHGVNKINCPRNLKRLSFYMDYYINISNLIKLEKSFKNNNFQKIKYFPHVTTFVPFFPLGLTSFKIKYLFNKSNYFYLSKFSKFLYSYFFLNK